MNQKYDNALHVMEVQGGSFVKSLVSCYYAADSTNKKILKDAFRSYFDGYEALYRYSCRSNKQQEPIQEDVKVISLDEQIKIAQDEIAAWSPEKRKNVRLEGFDPYSYRNKT